MVIGRRLLMDLVYYARHIVASMENCNDKRSKSIKLFLPGLGARNE